MNDDFEDYGPDETNDGGNRILLISFLVALGIFLVILGVSCLGRECVKGNDSSCTAYEQVQDLKEWIKETI